MDEPNIDGSLTDPVVERPVGGARGVGTPLPATSQSTWNDSMSQLDAYAEQLRVKLPAAPPGLLEGYMRYWPWVSMVLGVLGILVSLVGLIFGAALAPIFVLFGGAAGVSYSGALFVSLIAGLIINVLEVVGGYLMRQHRLTGWWLLAAGMIISALSSLFGRSVLALIVVLAIAYVHLQAKPHYT